MLWQELKLTPHEQEWNSVYDNGTKKGVLIRRYPSTLLGFTTAAPTQTVVFSTSRRLRVFKITWSGDVAALKVRIYTSTGEEFTVGSVHLPLLSGHGVTSRLSVSATALAGGYPTSAGTYALQDQPAWDFELEPNIVLPGAKQLFFEYSLENPADPLGGTFGLLHVVHCWEFPGFEGGA